MQRLVVDGLLGKLIRDQDVKVWFGGRTDAQIRGTRAWHCVNQCRTNMTPMETCRVPESIVRPESSCFRAALHLAGICWHPWRATRDSVRWDRLLPAANQTVPSSLMTPPNLSGRKVLHDESDFSQMTGTARFIRRLRLRWG